MNKNMLVTIHNIEPNEKNRRDWLSMLGMNGGIMSINVLIIAMVKKKFFLFFMMLMFCLWLEMCGFFEGNVVGSVISITIVL